MPTYCKKRDGDIKFMMMRSQKAKKILRWKPKIDLNKGLENLINDN